MDLSPLLPGDIILTRSSGLSDSLIRFGERVRYAGWRRALRWFAGCALRSAPADRPDDPWWANHAVVYVGDGKIIQAVASGGVVPGVLEQYSGTAKAYLRLADLRPDVTARDRHAAVRHAQTAARRHAAYGWLSIASIVAQRLTPAKLDVSWDGALICSALAAQCLEHAGVELPTRSSLTTMPADLNAMRVAAGRLRKAA